HVERGAIVGYGGRRYGLVVAVAAPGLIVTGPCPLPGSVYSGAAREGPPICVCRAVAVAVNAVVISAYPAGLMRCQPSQPSPPEIWSRLAMKRSLARSSIAVNCNW